MSLMSPRVAAPSGGLKKVARLQVPLSRTHGDDGASLRQIDKDDIRVLAQTVEDDCLAIGGNIERPHHAVIAQMREGASRVRGEIEQPEISRVRAWHVHQTL